MRACTGGLALLLSLWACGDEDRTQTEFTASIDKTSTSADDTAAVVAPAVPRPDTLARPAPPQDTFAIALAPLGRGTARGTGQVAAAGNAASISVALSQGTRGATYEGAVRQGVCSAMGASVASLHPVSTDSMGAGRASSDVPVSVDSLRKKPHVVVYGPGGRPEVCGPVRPGAPPPPSRGPSPMPHEPAATPDSMGRDG
jgi:hypothetical protein